MSTVRPPVRRMKALRGRNALLTGASRGLGSYIGRALAEQGVNVALTARTAVALRTTAEELESLGVRAIAIPADLGDPASCERVAERSTAEMGPIDILVNNAGMEWVARYTALSAADIATMVQTNLIAPLILSRLLLPGMIERGRGHIVTMSSLGGKKGSPYSATYAATKAALIEWTNGLREELRGTGVSASVICPGFVARAGMFAAYGKRAPWIVGETTPEKVAAAVIRAITRDLAEVIVNPGPVRLMMIADAICPGMMRWVLRTCGVYEFFRRQAEENERVRRESVPGRSPAP